MNYNVYEEFIKRCHFEGDCIVWSSMKNKGGYGLFLQNGKLNLAHRFAWKLFKGTIPKGLVLDHLCRKRPCVNVTHLEPVTNKINLLRGNGICARNARKTHCKYGHEFNEENTYRPKRGGRQCITCFRLYWKKYYEDHAIPNSALTQRLKLIR